MTNNIPLTQLTPIHAACLLRQNAEWRLDKIAEIEKNMECDPSVEDIKAMQGKIAVMITTLPVCLEIYTNLKSRKEKADDQTAEEIINLACECFSTASQLTVELLGKHPELNISHNAYMIEE